MRNTVWTGNPHDFLITEWLPVTRTCGPTGFGEDCRSNSNWCKCEVERLAGDGVAACVVRRGSHSLSYTGDEIAVAYLPDGMTATRLQAEFDKVSAKKGE